MTKSETNHWNLEFKCPSEVNFKNQRQTKSEENSKKRNDQKIYVYNLKGFDNEFNYFNYRV